MATSVQKVTGKAGAFTYNGTKLSITKYTAKVERELVDSTGSDNYDAATDLIHKAQLPVSIQVTADVEGQFDLNSTDASVIATLYSGATAIPVILGINAAVVLGHGNFDISDFECDVPIDDMVTWKATIKSNGVFTHGS